MRSDIYTISIEFNPVYPPSYFPSNWSICPRGKPCNRSLFSNGTIIRVSSDIKVSSAYEEIGSIPITISS